MPDAAADRRPSPPAHVYLLRRVVDEVLEVCRRAMPDEALGMLVGWRARHQGRRYVRVTDWVTGRVESGGRHARLTPEGLAQAYTELDERYGAERDGPQVVGLFHSHPFGGEPGLSDIDLATFDQFPYDAPGNVFVLVNPLTGHFLVFQRVRGGEVVEREWVAYEPQAIAAE